MQPTIMDSIGKKIKALRLQKEWLQVDIAKRLNISIPAYSKIESDITDITISRLKQIADIFEIELVGLIAENTNSSKSYLDELKKAEGMIEARDAKINTLQEYIIRLYEELHNLKQGKIIS